MADPSPELLDLQAALAGEYSIERELGRGGMGIVYLARDVQLDRDVAIKILPPLLAHDPAARERFLREARTAAGLSHPHIVPIHRVGEANGFVFFVMGYVQGESLGERLRTGGPLPPADATRVLREVAWALAYAHGRGVVHRDVKPDNILLEAGTGRAMVTDFGIAHAGNITDPRMDAGKVTGTAHYMSPEQAAGEPVDGRSDIYSLGVVGYVAVSGRLPFQSDSLAAMLVRQATEVPTSVMRVAPGLPSALGNAIDQCLARDPSDRFADGEALAAALAPAIEVRPALPAALRAWITARNPLLVPYMAWFGLFGTLTSVNLLVWLIGQRPDGPADILMLAGITSMPLLPIIGFHLNQARRQFKKGHTLADLRSALDVARREHAETEALMSAESESRTHRILRAATIASAGWLSVTFALVLVGVLHENRGGLAYMAAPVLSTLTLGAVSNALEVQFIPERIRATWHMGLRERLWNSRLGEWLAKRLGAPERTRTVGDGVFRATEAALGVAASELFAALPRSWREELAELPATVAALEARAAAARAEVDLGRKDAAAQLTESVAALEGIRLDLLRLHAGSTDLAPLTTLIDAARQLGEKASRLADAQREIEEAMGQES